MESDKQKDCAAEYEQDQDGKGGEDKHDVSEVDDSAPATKKRRVHLDVQQVDSLANSLEGAKALTDPHSVKKSSKDPNRGLYPRTPNLSCGAGQFSGFKPASEFKREEEVNIADFARNDVYYKPQSQGRGKKRTPQKNNLKNYFPTLPSPKKSTTQPSTSQSTSADNDGPPPSTFSPSKPEIVAKKLFQAQNTSPLSTVNRGKSSSSKPEPTINRDNALLCSNTPVPSTSREKPDKFGLCGKSDHISLSSDEEDIGDSSIWINSLPEELLENIFCRLPLMDMVLNVNHVCQLWNDIISAEKFVPWKKRYYKLKSGDTNTRTYLTNELQKNNLTKREHYLPGLVRMMRDIEIRRNMSAQDSANLSQHLAKHTMYACAVDVITERLPECVENGIPHPWSALALIVIMSENVADISEIFTVLLCSNSQCAVTAMHVLEVLYCIATYLLLLKTMYFKEIWNGMHYRLFYGLYLYENDYTTTAKDLKSTLAKSSGQQSIMRYSSSSTNVQMTHEQVRICKHDLQPGQVMKIIAFAGTGKTTTLVRYTQMRPHLKFLLVVYNKSVSDHAKTQFPSNVTVKTGHSLAFAHTGFRYKNAGKLAFGGIRMMEVIEHFRARKGESMYVQAKLIMDTITAFMASADQRAGTHHVPATKTSKIGDQVAVVDETWKSFYAECARDIWEKMQNENDHSIMITHDGYLKAYQLRRPRITGYDVILIDEAQDMTPSLADVLFQQPQPKILVGDPHQQIYAFRGATNAMQQVPATHTFYLTQSFRFGPEIAFVAASCIEFLKNERKKTLVGNGKAGAVDGTEKGQVAIISRTNFILFNEAVKKLCYNDTNIRAAFVGGTAGFGFPMILDIYLLSLPPGQRSQFGKPIQNPLISKFNSLAALDEFATKTMDMELLGKIKIVRTHHSNIPSFLNTLQSKCLSDLDSADLVFSTAHKAKGLEFSTVKLTDDFNIGMNGLIGLPIRNQDDQDDENNILYVAVTRAKKRLILSQTLYMTLTMIGENFMYPKHTKELRKTHKTFKCLKTEQEFEPCAGTIIKKSLAIHDGTQKPGGLISPEVISEQFPAWKQLFGLREEQRKSDDDDDDDDDDDGEHRIPDLRDFGFNILAGMNVPIGQFVVRL